MASVLHNPPEGIKNIYSWYKKAQIDYTEHYIKMYITYNAWYRQVTMTTNDRQALATLKKRFVIWDDYLNERTMVPLKIYMERLVDLTQREPLASSVYWSGSIESASDWRSLIEYWYQIRCLIVHGVYVKPRYVWLAYETLDIYMGEIIDRMHQCFNQKDMDKLKEITSMAEADPNRSDRFQKIQQKLYQKYIASPNIWQVDMKRAGLNNDGA